MTKRIKLDYLNFEFSKTFRKFDEFTNDMILEFLNVLIILANISIFFRDYEIIYHSEMIKQKSISRKYCNNNNINSNKKLIKKLINSKLIFKRRISISVLTKQAFARKF